MATQTTTDKGGPSERNGSSNSHSTATTGGSKVEAGVDTWSICWYVRDGGKTEVALKQLATARGPRSLLIPHEIAGHRVGWFPGSRLLFAEGHPVPERLAPAADLPGAMDRICEGMSNYGILPERHLATDYAAIRSPVPRLTDGVGFAGVRRLDSTVNLHFEDPLEGLAALTGVAALPLPRLKTQVIREAGGRRVETVYFRGSSGKKVLGRWYDKGVESGTAKRGAFIRPEDQRRFTKAFRPGVDVLADSTFVRDAFVRRFEPLWKAAQGIKVSGTRGLASKLGQLVAEGELTARMAESMAGYLILEETGQFHAPKRTCERRRAQARHYGLSLADGVIEDVEVDLSDVMERALDSATWGSQG